MGKCDDVAVSVFCLAYNHEKYIRKTLEGFVSQKTSFKYEVVVHDDACLLYTSKNCKTGILYIEADGAALNTRHKNAEGSTWRENKLGVVYSSDHIHWWKNKKGERQHRIDQREYVSYVGTASEFSRHLYRCATENGYGCYPQTVILSDGAAWIANMVEEYFPDAQQDVYKRQGISHGEDVSSRVVDIGNGLGILMLTKYYARRYGCRYKILVNMLYIPSY